MVTASAAALGSPLERWGGLALGGFALAALASGLLGVVLIRRSLVADSRALDAMVRTAARDPDGVVVPELRTRECSDVARAFAGALRRLRSQQQVLESIAGTLRTRSSELERAQRLARLGGWAFEADGGRFVPSPEVREMFGAVDAESLASLDDLLARVPEAERAAVRAAFRLAIEGRAELELVHRVVRPDGQVRQVRQRARRVAAAEGAPVWLQGTAQDVTDLESAREIATLYEAALGGTDDVVLIGEIPPAGAVTPVVWVNEAMARIAGQDRSSMTGSAAGLLEAAGIAREAFDRVVEALRRGEPTRTEVRIARHDGESVWVELQVSPIATRAGTYTHWVAVGRDTTQRREAEQRVRASEARYRHMFDDHPLPLWIYDFETLAIVDANRAASLAFGYGRDEYLGMRISELVPPEGEAEFGRAVRTVRERGVYGGALWFRRRDGVLRRVELHGASTVMDGRRVRIVSPVDRTEALQAREALERLNATLEETVAARTASLRLSEARYRTLAELSPQIIWQADARGEATFLSRRWFELAGEREDGWLGLRWMEALPEADVRATRRAFAAARRAGGPMRVRRRVRGGDGRLHSMLTVAAPVVSVDGAIESWVGVDTDVGELESVQRELSAAVDRLEAFSYSVSHDLRAPVHVIAGFSGVLLAGQVGKVDDEARHYLERIASNAARMESLITDLLALAGLGRDGLSPRRFDLAGMLREVVDAQRERGSERSIELEAPPACEVCADPSLVRILLENLVGNAVKFSARQPVSRLRLDVETMGGELGEERIFSLEDNGTGFPQEYAARLFQPFQRLHRPDEFPGSGIGLAIVARIVALHHGRVWARAGGQGGARFSFTLGPAR